MKKQKPFTIIRNEEPSKVIKKQKSSKSILDEIDDEKQEIWNIVYTICVAKKNIIETAIKKELPLRMGSTAVFVKNAKSLDKAFDMINDLKMKDIITALENQRHDILNEEYAIVIVPDFSFDLAEKTFEKFIGVGEETVSLIHRFIYVKNILIEGYDKSKKVVSQRSISKRIEI